LGDPHFTGALRRILSPLSGRLSEVAAEVVELFTSGVSALLSPGRMLRIVLLSAALWASVGAAIWFVLISFPFGGEMPLRAVFLISSLLPLAVMIPASPISFGLFQYLSVLSLSLFGVERGNAIGVSVVMHVTISVPVTAVGIVFLWRNGVSFRRLLGHLRSGESFSRWISSGIGGGGGSSGHAADHTFTDSIFRLTSTEAL